MRIRFVDEARLEFLDAISYYQGQQPELPHRFKVEVEQSTRWLAEHIEAQPFGFSVSLIQGRGQSIGSRGDRDHLSCVRQIKLAAD